MAAWDDLTLDVGEVKGHAENLLTDRQDGMFNADLIDDQRTRAAKGHLQDVLFSEGTMDEHIDSAGGHRALLNDLASEDSLETELQRGFALAFLAKFAGDAAVISGGRTVERQGQFQGELENWARSFGNYAPKVLGYTSRTKTSTGGGAFAQSYDRHDL